MANKTIWQRIVKKIGWGDILEKPSEFPPEAHTHTPEEAGAEASGAVAGHEADAVHIERLKAHGVVSGEVGVLLTEGNLHTFQIDGSAALNVTWRDDGADQGETLILRLMNAGAPNSISINLTGLGWVGKTVPTFTPSGKDVVMIQRFGASEYIANALLNIGEPT